MRKQKSLLSLVTVIGLILQLLSGFVTSGLAYAAETAPKQVVLVESLQKVLGNADDWDPASTKTQMAYQGNGLFTFTGI
jgi:hypothetical protein